MLGIKYAYLMIMFFDKDSFELEKIKKLKELIMKKKQKKNNLEREK